MSASSLTAHAMMRKLEAAMTVLSSETAKERVINFDESKYAKEVDRRLRVTLGSEVEAAVETYAEKALAA